MAIYALSDIHGQYNTFIKMLDEIEFSDNDELYILGDIFDRGPNNLPIYDYIRNKSNIHILMGNHEKMLVEYAMSVKNHLADMDAVRNSRRAGQAYDLCIRNGAKSTFLELASKDQDYIDELVKYIRNLPYFYKLEVDGRKFLLCHAKPYFYYGKTFQESLALSILNEDIIWNRSFFDEEIPDNYTIIHGHTPGSVIHSYCYGNVYNIDCGCARGHALGCLRLDDMKEYYVKC